MILKYSNLTRFDVDILYQNGEIEKVRDRSSVTTTKENPIIKIKYSLDNKWEKV